MAKSLNRKNYIPFTGFYDLRKFALSDKEFLAAWRIQNFLYLASLKRDYYKQFDPMEWEEIKELEARFQMFLLPKLKAKEDL